MRQVSLADLKPDKKNARKHNPRNLGMIESSLRQVGAARSGVIDEHGVILAGNGTYEALAAAGIEKVKIVEADGNEWVVVERKGLTEKQKRILSVSDNRTSDLATWDGPTLEAQGIDLKPWFSEEELNRTKKPSEFGLHEIGFDEQKENGRIGFESKISLVVPAEDYETARKAMLTLTEGHPTWDVRFPK
jgi:hypothetical protein